MNYLLEYCFIFSYFAVSFVFSNARFQKPQLNCPRHCNVLVERNVYKNNSLKNDFLSVLSLEQCTVIADTMLCENRTKDLLKIYLKSLTESFNNNNLKTHNDDNSTLDPVQISSTSVYPPCQSKILTVDIVPYIFHPEDYKPLAQINITVSVNDGRTVAVGIRQTCISSGPGPDGREELCWNHSRPAWGRFYWPCRMFDVSNLLYADETEETKLVLPANFSYTCYRAAPLALMTIRVTLYPQLCENVYIYRMIGDYHINANVLEDWLPLVFVDTNDERYVRIQYHQPPLKLQYTSIVIDIIDSKTTKILETKTLSGKERTFLLTNIKRGQYTAVVHVWHSKCLDHKCKTTYVPFNLTHDYYDVQEQPSQEPFTEAWKPILIVIGIILILVSTVAVCLTVYCRFKIRRRHERAVAIEFVDRPKVFMVYTDDNIEHRHCVIQLAEYLRNTANCEVYLDEWTFRNVSSRHARTNPTEWVHNCLTQSDYYLLIFSEGSKITFDSPRTHELIPERPWAETFGLTISYLLEEILRQTRADPRTKLSKFVCVTFSYSSESCVPSLFRSLPCRNYRLLNDLADLICHLHKLTSGNFTNNLGCHRLSTHVDKTRRYYESNPSWLNERLTPINNNLFSETTVVNGVTTTSFNGEIAQISAAIESLQNGNVVIEEEKSLDELYANSTNNSSSKYPLLPPVDSDTVVDKSTKKYQLLPPDEDIFEDDDLILDCHKQSSNLPLMSNKVNSSTNCNNNNNNNNGSNDSSTVSSKK